MAEELALSQKQALMNFATTTTRWSEAACGSIIAALTRRQDQLAVHYVSVRNSSNGRTDRETIANQSELLAELEDRHAKVTTALHRLNTVNAAIDEWFNHSAKRDLR